jgi:hypothetical protein
MRFVDCDVRDAARKFGIASDPDDRDEPSFIAADCSLLTSAAHRYCIWPMRSNVDDGQNRIRYYSLQ